MQPRQSRSPPHVYVLQGGEGDAAVAVEVSPHVYVLQSGEDGAAAAVEVPPHVYVSQGDEGGAAVAVEVPLDTESWRQTGQSSQTAEV